MRRRIALVVLIGTVAAFGGCGDDGTDKTTSAKDKANAAFERLARKTERQTGREINSVADLEDVAMDNLEQEYARQGVPTCEDVEAGIAKPDKERGGCFDREAALKQIREDPGLLK